MKSLKKSHHWRERSNIQSWKKNMSTRNTHIKHLPKYDCNKTQNSWMCLSNTYYYKIYGRLGLSSWEALASRLGLFCLGLSSRDCCGRLGARRRPATLPVSNGNRPTPRWGKTKRRKPIKSNSPQAQKHKVHTNYYIQKIYFDSERRGAKIKKGRLMFYWIADHRPAAAERVCPLVRTLYLR